jgi:hypothetical protein
MLLLPSPSPAEAYVSIFSPFVSLAFFLPNYSFADTCRHVRDNY